VAQELVLAPTETHWRTAVGRAYYALMLEGRDALARWGFAPPRQNVHSFVRLRFGYASDPDLKSIGFTLDRLSQWRNHADYQLTSGGSFATNVRASQAITESRTALALLDQIEADPVRRAAAIASLPP
jgi:hypothetical protein